MAEVVGGNTKTPLGRIAEIVAWFPSLLALLAVGATSLAVANHLVTLPSWVQSALGYYHNIRDAVTKMALGKAAPGNYADAAIVGIPLVTMIARKVIGFVFSIGGFVILAVAAWFLLRKFG